MMYREYMSIKRRRSTVALWYETGHACMRSCLVIQISGNLVETGHACMLFCLVVQISGNLVGSQLYLLACGVQFLEFKSKWRSKLRMK